MIEITENTLIIENDSYKINSNFLKKYSKISNYFISQIENGILTPNYMFSYGILRSSILFDYDIGYIGFLHSKINELIGMIY